MSAPEVRLLVRIEDDPTVFPITESGISVYAHIDGTTPIIGVRHVNVDPCAVGEAVLGLLRAATIGGHR
jgi:hypothetical protein